MARRYQPHARWRPLAAAAALGAALAAAAGVAVVGHLMARAGWPLLLLLPALQGGAVAIAVRATMRRAGPLHPRLAFFVAAAAAGVALVGQAQLDLAHARSWRAASEAAVREAQRAAGVPDTALAQPGRRLELAGALARRYADGGLGPDTAALLACTELAIAALLAGVLARAGARDPVCPRCGGWREATPLGRAALGASAPLVAALLADDPASAAAAVTTPDTREAVLLAVFRCPRGHDRDDGVLRVAELRLERRRRTSHRLIAELEVQARELAALRDALT